MEKNLIFVLISFVLIGPTSAIDKPGTWGNSTFEPYYLNLGAGRIHPEFYTEETLLQEYLRYHIHQNPLLRPGIHPFETTKNPTTDVDVELYFQAVGDVDSMDMNFITTVYLTQSWYDRRLRIEWLNRKEESLSVHYDNSDFLWLPDTFMKNELEALKHANTRNNIMVRIYNNGTVLFNRKVTMTLSCQMLLQRFPFDQQECGMRISSFSYPIEHVKYHWHRKLPNPAKYNPFINLPEYAVTGIVYSTCEDVRFNMTYSCLDVTLHIQRSFSFYMIQDFVPSSLVVTIACLSFWIDPNAVPARITLGLVNVVTITTQMSSLTSNTPRVYYVRAIDIWMSFCLLITMAAMIEYSVVNTLQRKRVSRSFYQVGAVKKDDSSSENSSQGSDVFSTQSSEVKMEETTPKLNAWQRVFGRYRDDEPGYVDAVCRALFPAVFLVFAVIYWVTYQVIYTHHPTLPQFS